MSRPRIALDLHTLAGLMQGSRTYAWNLARRLPELAPEYDFLFHLPAQGGAASGDFDLPPRPNVLRRGLPASRAARLLTFGARLALEHADLLHCQYLAPPFAPCPVVLAVHDVLHESHPEFYPGGMRLLMRRLYPLSARKAAVVLTCSEHSRREIVRRYGLDERRVLAVPLAASEEFRPARGEEELAAAGATAARYGLRGRYVLFVGRLEPKKNIPALVRAFRSLPGRVRSGLTLAVAGMADPLFFPQLVRELGRDAPDVVLTGRVAQEDLPRLYQGAALFVFPSHAEGFGLPPLEAMACGAPVVASRATSLPEVVGDAGILFDPADEAALARALESALTDQDVRATLAARGLERSRLFSWERTARQTLEAYRTALAGRRQFR